MPYLSTFGQEFSKTIVIFEISTLKFVWLQVWDYGLEFEKILVIFEISVLEIVLLQSLVQK